MAVYFLAAVQKVVHGFWLTGEYLMHALLYAPEWNTMAFTLRCMFAATSSILGLQPVTHHASAFTHAARETAHVPAWALGSLLAMSWTIVIAELVLPLGVLAQRWRRHAVAGLVILQIGVAAMTGIWGFGITGSACLLLFFPEHARMSYALLILATCAAAMVGGSGRLPFTWM